MGDILMRLQKMELTKPQIIRLPKITDPRGNLSVIQSLDNLPFSIARCYWVYDVPSGMDRDGHAFYTSSELIVSLSGSFSVETDDGHENQTFLLNRPDVGLYLPPMVWRNLKDFSTNAVAMLLSSELYDPADYINDYNLFRQINEAR